MKCVKVSFSKDGAHTALRKIIKRGKVMRAYQCEKCFRWHLTSDTKGRQNWPY